MQTFLPYADFHKTARCLDYRRLGKQRVEAKQIIDLLMKEKMGVDITKLPWGNHPAVKMWKGYLPALIEYYNIIVKEWISRGYNNNMLFIGCPAVIKYPLWFGRTDFHDAHKSNLLRKNYDYYSKFGWNVSLDLKYIWM